MSTLCSNNRRRRKLEEKCFQHTSLREDYQNHETNKRKSKKNEMSAKRSKNNSQCTDKPLKLKPKNRTPLRKSNRITTEQFNALSDVAKDIIKIRVVKRMSRMFNVKPSKHEKFVEKFLQDQGFLLKKPSKKKSESLLIKKSKFKSSRIRDTSESLIFSKNKYVLREDEDVEFSEKVGTNKDPKDKKSIADNKWTEAENVLNGKPIVHPVLTTMAKLTEILERIEKVLNDDTTSNANTQRVYTPYYSVLI